MCILLCVLPSLNKGFTSLHFTLIDCLLACLIDWLIDWLIEWVSECLPTWLTVWLTHWLIDWLVGWLIDWLTDQPTNWLIVRLTDSLPACLLLACLSDWLNGSLTGLQGYIFPQYDTYLDTRATVRYALWYITVRDKTSYEQLPILLNNLFHNNKFNTVITQHQITLQGLKCRAWVRNIKDGDFPNLLM